MVNRVVLAVIIGIAVALGCGFLGTVLQATDQSLAEAVGSFLRAFSVLIGILAGLYWFFSRGGVDGRV